MDLKLCSLNLGIYRRERLKRRETRNWLRARNTLLKTQLQLGRQNGAIKLCLTAALASVVESQFSLRIISPFS